MFKSNKCNYTITGPNGKVETKDKIKYLKVDDAVAAAKMMNEKPKTLHKFVPYKCTKCFFFHIGKSTQINQPKNGTNIFDQKF